MYKFNALFLVFVGIPYQLSCNYVSNLVTGPFYKGKQTLVGITYQTVISKSETCLAKKDGRNCCAAKY